MKCVANNNFNYDKLMIIRNFFLKKPLTKYDCLICFCAKKYIVYSEDIVSDLVLMKI